LAPSFDAVDVQNVDLYGSTGGQVHVVVNGSPGNVIELGAINKGQYLYFVYLDLFLQGILSARVGRRED
jgi:hypothetical protein